MSTVQNRIRRPRKGDRRRLLALLVTSAVAVAVVGAVMHEAGAGAANRVSPPLEAAPVILSTLPAAEQPAVEEIAAPSDAAVDPKGGSWIQLTVPFNTPWATKATPERATYANWLGEVTAAGIQGQLLATGKVGLAGAIVQPAASNDFPAEYLSDSFVMGTPDVGAYALPGTDLNDGTLIADAYKRALAANVTLQHIEVLSLGRWKAIAIVLRSDADAESTAAAWYPIVRELLPTDLHDAVVGYYIALEDALGNPVHINTTGYLADITSTWTDPTLKTDPGLLADPVLHS